MEKILYIANARIPTEKAHGYQIMKMCESFCRKGADVVLYIPSRLNRLNNDPFSFYGISELFPIVRLWTVDLLNAKLPVYFSFFIQYFSFIFSVLPTILFKRQGAIYTRDALIGVCAALCGRRVIFEKHTRSRTDKYLLPVLNIFNAKFVAITDFHKKMMVNNFNIIPDRVIVSHDGVDVDIFKRTGEDIRQIRLELGLPIEKRLLLYVGQLKTMGREKGIEWIADILPKIIKSFPSLTFVSVGGSTAEVENYLKKVKNLDLPGSALFIGNVPRFLVPKYLKAADYLLLPYPNTEHYAYFMSPLKLFEYMAAGRVIVTSDLPSIREILDERTAVFFVPNKPESLVLALKKVIYNTSFSEEISKNCQELAKRYTWINRAETILNFING